MTERRGGIGEGGGVTERRGSIGEGGGVTEKREGIGEGGEGAFSLTLTPLESWMWHKVGLMGGVPTISKPSPLPEQF